MKIQLDQPWQDGAKTFKKYAVLQMADSDAQRLIAEGYGHRVPDDTRLFVSETLITACVAPFTPTGEEIALDELTGDKKPAKTGLKKVVFGVD